MNGMRKSKISSDPVMSKLMDRLGKVSKQHGSRCLKALKAIIKRINQKADPVLEGKVKGVRWKGLFDKS